MLLNFRREVPKVMCWSQWIFNKLSWSFSCRIFRGRSLWKFRVVCVARIFACVFAVPAFCYINTTLRSHIAFHTVQTCCFQPKLRQRTTDTAVEKRKNHNTKPKLNNKSDNRQIPHLGLLVFINFAVARHLGPSCTASMKRPMKSHAEYNRPVETTTLLRSTSTSTTYTLHWIPTWIFKNT